MRILKMKLENFQGVKELLIEPQGESCSVYGDNGTGKTTIYNAFTWLMYGKPSTGEKNYTPKTTETHNLHHCVEMTVQMDDGSVMVLKKDFHEVYKTVKGSAQAVLSGHTTDYSVDGVPVNETQFKKTLTGIFRDEELAKMLTMYDYFLEDMKIADRRKVLLQICGDVSMDEVIERAPELNGLKELLRKPGNTSAMYTVEEYRAIAGKEKSLTDRELKDIPHRIDEAERAKPDTDGADSEAVDKEINSIRDARRELEEQRASGESTAAAAIRQQIAELESQRAAGESKHTRAEADKNKNAFSRISELRRMKSDIQRDLLQIGGDKLECENEIDLLNRRREALLKEWQEENEKEWTGNEICPTCNRPLPPEEIAQAKEAFHIRKAKRLEEINRMGVQQCSGSMIQEKQDEVERLIDKFTKQQSVILEIEENIKAEESAVIAAVEYSTTDEYKEFTEQIDKLYDKMKDIRAAAAEANHVRNSKLSELDTALDAAMKKRAAIEFVKKQDARIAELEAQEKELAAQYERLQAGLHLCEVYLRTKAKMLDEKINRRFQTLRFRLFIEQQNGGIADDCEALIPCKGGMVAFKSANHAARVNAGLEVIDVLADHYGVQLPVFLDNSESVTNIRKTEAQMLRLVVSEPDKTLRFEKGDI